MHGHTKFGTWHPYTLRMVTRVSERRSSPWACASHAVHTPLQMSGEHRQEIPSGMKREYRAP